MGVRNVLLSLGLMTLLPRPGHASAPANLLCQDIPSCVAIAEQQPSTFSPTLRDAFRQLSGAVLIDGLSFQHPRSEVTALVQHEVHHALTSAEGHTLKSADALLHLALSSQDRKLRGEWLARLANDAEGRRALANFIDSGPEEELRFELMALYVSYDPERVFGELSNANSCRDTAQSPSRLRAPAIARYIDELWGRYLKLRRRLGVTSAKGAAQAIDLPFHRKFMGRLMTLVRGEIAAKQMPLPQELERLVNMAAAWDQSVFSEMLSWVESTQGPARRLIARSMLRSIDRAEFTRDEIPRVRRMLIAGATDKDDPWCWEYAYSLPEFLSGSSVEEAALVAQIAEWTTQKDELVGLELRMAIAQEHSQYRASVIALLMDSEIEKAERLTRTGLPAPPWVGEFAVHWIRALEPEALRDEATQERFLIVSRLLPTAVSNWLSFPESRRIRAERYGCYTGYLQNYEAAVDERKDLKAFGLPVPAGTPVLAEPSRQSRGNHIADLPPLSEKEAVARWQEFVRAREDALRHSDGP